MADNLEQEILTRGDSSGDDKAQHTSSISDLEENNNNDSEGCSSGLQKMIEDAVKKALNAKGIATTTVDDEGEDGAHEECIEELDDDESSEVGPDIAGSVKELIIKRSTELLSENLFGAKMKKHVRPGNLNLFSPRVNPEIWTGLSMPSRSRDKNLRSIHQIMMKAMIPLAIGLSKLVETDNKELMMFIIDGVSLLGQAMMKTNLLRVGVLLYKRSLCRSLYNYASCCTILMSLFVP